MLFIHGNASSSVIWEPILDRLEPMFYGVAPDLCGYGLSDPSKTILASEGLSCWAKDLEAFYTDVFLSDQLPGTDPMFAKKRPVERSSDTVDVNAGNVILVGHSLGALIAMEIIARNVIPVAKAILYAPPPPYGYPARAVDPKFLHALAQKDTYHIQQVVRALFWHPAYHHPQEQEIIEAVLQMQLGPKAYPEATIEAISPERNTTLQARLLQRDTKPPIEWVRGLEDVLVSNSGFNAPTFSMIDEMQHFLEHYTQLGGYFEPRTYSPCGHSPFLEIEAEASLLCGGGSIKVV